MLKYETENVEKYIAVKNNKVSKHYSKWQGLNVKGDMNVNNKLLSDFVEEYVNSIEP